MQSAMGWGSNESSVEENRPTPENPKRDSRYVWFKLAYNNSDKVGWLYWYAKGQAFLYWHCLPYPLLKFFARLSCKKAALPFLFEISISTTNHIIDYRRKGIWLKHI